MGVVTQQVPTIKIYNWVRNTVEWVPTYGAIQTSDMTLATLRGNSFDTASLLIALLRAANVPARYAYGVIEVPADKIQNWVGGVDNPSARRVRIVVASVVPTFSGWRKVGKHAAFDLPHMQLWFVGGHWCGRQSGEAAASTGYSPGGAAIFLLAAVRTALSMAASTAMANSRPNMPSRQ